MYKNNWNARKNDINISKLKTIDSINNFNLARNVLSGSLITTINKTENHLHVSVSNAKKNLDKEKKTNKRSCPWNNRDKIQI